MKKPTCKCFESDDGQARVNVIATETMTYFSQLIDELRTCPQTDEYLTLTMMVLLGRGMSGAVDRVEVSDEEDAARFEALLLELPEKLRAMNKAMNASVLQ